MAVDALQTPDYSILAAFGRKIVRPRTSILYLATLLLVTITMLLLPLLYFSFAAVVGWAVYYHATHNGGLIMGGGLYGPRMIILKLFLYVTPLLAGVGMLLFLFKPIFARQPKQAQPLALNPASEPLLFAFIHKICENVGAPSPTRIDLDCQLNASAGFRRGFRSLFSNDMVLKIGLPLVANLNAREFAGVVAHEFGHFTQGLGMRLSYVVRRINAWFARVAYERDAWDVYLEQLANEEKDHRITAMIMTVQMGIWFSRSLLKLLMITGHILAGFMLRQMEYDADCYEIKIGGSAAFESAHRKLATLDVTFQKTHDQMQKNWKKYRTLPDDLPESLRQQHEQLPAAQHQKINDTLGLTKTSLFESHPSPGDRIREARKAADPGIFSDERPASQLFSAFEYPSRFVTLLHYTDDLGIPITQQMLTPVQCGKPVGMALAKSIAQQNDFLHEYFLGILPLMLPLHPGTLVASKNWEVDSAELNQLSASLKQLAAQLADGAGEYAQATEKMLEARTAKCLISSGVPVDPAKLGTAEATETTAANVEKEAVYARDSISHSFREIIVALTRRFELGLSLALANEGGAVNQTSDGSDFAMAVSALANDADIFSKRKQVADALAVLNRIKGMQQTHSEFPAWLRAVEKQSRVVVELGAPFLAKPEAEAVAPKAGLRLQTTPRIPGGAPTQEVEILETETNAWLADYEKRLEELARIAASMEVITG